MMNEQTSLLAAYIMQQCEQRFATKAEVQDVPQPVMPDVPSMKEIADYLFPIGFKIGFAVDFDPNEHYYGTWVREEGVFYLAASESHPIGETGGEETVTLTIDEMPAHSHKLSNRSGAGAGSYWNAPPLSSDSGSAHTADEGSVILSNGGGQPHNNMPPYQTFYAWTRVA